MNTSDYIRRISRESLARENQTSITFKPKQACSSKLYNIIELDKVADYVNNHTTCHEIINEDNPVKLYLDIDGIILKTDKNMDLINRVMRTAKCHNYNVLDSKRIIGKKYIKISIHLCHNELGFINNKYQKYYIQEQMETEGTFLNKLSKLKNRYIIDKTGKRIIQDKEMKSMIDFAVYGNHSLRTIYQCKETDSTIKLIPFMDENPVIEDYLITLCPKEFIDISKYEKLYPEGKKTEIVENKRLNTGRNDQYKDVNIDEVRELVDNMTSRYYDVREEWFSVGAALYNIEDSEEMLNIYHEFSKKSYKYTESSTTELWNSLDKKGDKKLGFKTLITISEMSNSENFKIIRDKYRDINMKNKMMRNRKELRNKDNHFTYGHFQKKWRGTKIFEVEDMLEDLCKCVAEISTKNKFYIVKCGEVDRYLKVTEHIKLINLKADMRDKAYIIMCPELPGGPKINIRFRSLDEIIKRERGGIYSKILHHNTLQFFPKELDEDICNLWTGMKAKKLKEEDYDINRTKIVLDHIKKIWAKDNEKVYEFIIQWISQLLQKPWKKTEIMLVLEGKSGCGKGIIIDLLMEELIGLSHSSITNDMDSITSKFNSIVAHKVLIVIDEAVTLKGEFYKAWNKIKNLVTCLNQWLELKGIDKVSILDFCNYIILTNNAGSFHCENNDRRIGHFKCSDDYAASGKYSAKVRREYFDVVSKSIREDSNHLFTFFMNYDTKDYNLEENLPESKEKKELKMSRLDNTLGFMKCIITESNDYDEDLLFIEDMSSVSSKKLHENYMIWAEKDENINRGNKYSKIMNCKELGHYLNKYIKTDTRSKTSKYKMWKIDHKDIINKINIDLNIDFNDYLC